MVKETKVRQSNIELLRIILMGMIVVHHLIVHGIGIGTLGNVSGGKQVLVLFTNAAVVMSVNTFLFISGYFGIQFKLKSLLSLWMQAVFYSLLIGGVFHFWKGSPFNPVFSAFPISSSLWWYLTNFIGLYLLSPFINKGVELLSKTQLLLIVIGLFYFNCVAGSMFRTFGVNDGYSFFSFLFLYLLARYLKTRTGVPSVALSLVGYFLCVVFVFLLALFFVKRGRLDLAVQVFAYNNPLVIAMSVCFFYLFQQLSFQNKVVNYVSSLVFGVYLIHDHYLVRDLLSSLFRTSTEGVVNLKLIGFLLWYALLIFASCASVEWLRTCLFKPILEKISKIKAVSDLETNLSN
jgi:hypothetical protein